MISNVINAFVTSWTKIVQFLIFGWNFLSILVTLIGDVLLIDELVVLTKLTVIKYLKTIYYFNENLANKYNKFLK